MATLLALLASSGLRAAPDGGAGTRRELTVFAAASLRDVFTELGESFERTHPTVRLRFNFAGSQELRTQLEHGAPADVFASADVKQMDGARAAGLVESSLIFATNEPVIVVPRDNPSKVLGLADLPSARRLVLGAPEVPIGAYTLQILDKARARFGPDFPVRVEARVVSRELNVRQVLTKVSLGEADAGVVYRTDARAAAAKVKVVDIPPELNVLAEYPMAIVKSTRQWDLARSWVEMVEGSAGRAALAESGFGPPPAR